ncbi:HNH endonuclease domain protein [Nostoc sp. NIES-3756]|uniref:HNH endonuclease n=1 Tax=Nostoc sp. NIES-3756 TaxID=1751286 RepID=UPI000721DFE4|nr:HNH endonuclease [Nostoc sp. NIES-3756]BAT52744.1 HNH endonuclease domain protein [Nostoc sp. NIES-3756]
MKTLEKHIAKLYNGQPNSKFDYYAVTILADLDSNYKTSCYSHWVGYADIDRRIELREASLIRADVMARLWLDIGQGYIVVDSLEDMSIFLLLGGNGLVEKSVADSAIPEIIEPSPVVPTNHGGFVHVNSLHKSAFNRAPTPKHRMQIIQRDSFRCRICGRRPADYVDVELHVHHIRPWGMGGLTQDENLITLCHTCHKGLDPHYNPNLFDLISPTKRAFNAENFANDYWEGVQRYQQTILKALLEANEN